MCVVLNFDPSIIFMYGLFLCIKKILIGMLQDVVFSGNMSMWMLMEHLYACPFFFFARFIA